MTVQQWGLLLLFALVAHPGWAQDPRDVVTAPLPDSLTQDAGMVKRLDVTEIDIESPRKAKLHRKYIYTVLGPTGDGYSRLYTFYDKYHELGDVSAALYDAAGRVVKKVKKSDLEDWNIDGMGMLMMDARVKIYRFGYHVYPYSIAFEESETLNGLFGLQPQWAPQPENFVSVVSGDLVIRAPGDYPLQYRAYHLPEPLITTDKKGLKTYTWQLTDRPVPKREPYAPAWFEREPRVSLAPGSFEIEGYKGSCDSWSDLGRFVGALHRDRGQLPEEARRKVHGLVDGLTDDREKIRVLYRFLQQSTHYVGIELGIGGWQPYDAAYVYNKKYGDCKALSNYMVALLKEAGVRAYPVLIRGGVDQPPVDTGFVCSQFNHEIAVAFTGRDTVWLECTSSALPAGYLGSFTADRDALLLDEKGGHLIHTPVYGVQENKVIRTLNGGIDDRGGLQAGLLTIYSGLSQDRLQQALNTYTQKELLEQRRLATGLSGALISDLKDTALSGPIPTLQESMQLDDEGFATILGNRLMVSPGIFTKHLPRLQKEADRKTGFELRESQIEIDSIVLRLPPNYIHEGNLPSANFSAVFGTYHFSCRFESGLLKVVCDFRQYKGTYPAEEYARLVRFFNLVYREANRELVFVQKP